MFHIEPGYDSGNGACFIFSQKLSYVYAELLSSSRGNLTFVAFRDASKGTEFSSGFVDLKFVLSFVLEKHEMKLSDTDDSASVELHGSDEMSQSLEVCMQYFHHILFSFNRTRKLSKLSYKSWLVNSQVTLVLV